MYDGYTVIDVHGHMSTPPQFRAYAYNLIALRTPRGGLELSEEEIQPALRRHIKMLDERGIDVQLVSARPVAMMHWERPFLQEHWARITNNVIYQHCQLYPDRFVGIAQLPQSRDLDTRNCLDELDRCVTELGFVGALVNPDPGGDRQTPGMNAEYWFPLYERAQQLQVPLIVHPSISRDPRIESLSHSYQYNNVTEETLATLLLEQSDVFEIFPELKIIVCHCGGSLRRTMVTGSTVKGRKVRLSGESGGGSIGIRVRRSDDEEAAEKDLSNNLFFDACAYDPAFLEAAIQQRGADRMLFGTEVPGTGTRVINPVTERPSDYLVEVIDSFEFLSAQDKKTIFHDNALRVFPRLKVE